MNFPRKYQNVGEILFRRIQKNDLDRKIFIDGSLGLEKASLRQILQILTKFGEFRQILTNFRDLKKLFVTSASLRSDQRVLILNLT